MVIFPARRLFRKILLCFSSFWERYPALFCATFLIVGVFLAFRAFWAALPALFFALPFWKDKKKLLALIALITAGFAFTSWRCSPYTGPLEGSFHFHCSRVQTTQTPFSKVVRYFGAVKTARGTLPCRITVKEGPTANCDYHIIGKLFSKDKRRYTLKPDKHTPWQKIPNTFSLAHLRQQTKNNIKTKLQTHLSSKEVALFLGGLATGEFDDPLLMQTFKNLGLVHLLCISGFHFALIAWFLTLFSRLFLPLKLSAFLVLLLMTLYYLFIGMTPAIQRAYIGASLYLIALVVEAKNSPLNTLGVALCLLLTINPLHILSLGFAFSYVATLAILLLEPPCRHLLGKLFAPQPYQQLVAASFWGQGGAILSALAWRALSLSLAVHLAVLPLSFFFFHRFAPIAIITNLFFPPLFAFSLLLLLLALPLSFLFPQAGGLLFVVEGHYVQFLLNLAHKIPASLMHPFYVKGVSPLTLAVVLTALFTWGVIEHRRHTDAKDLTFLS